MGDFPEIAVFLLSIAADGLCTLIAFVTARVTWDLMVNYHAR